MGLLAAGAGASEGLDQFLKRMLLEQAQQQRTSHENASLAETTRSNKADEAFRSADLTERTKFREGQQVEATRQHDLAEGARVRTDQNADNARVMTGVRLRADLGGGPVSLSEGVDEMKAGAPRGTFEKEPVLGEPGPNGARTLTGFNAISAKKDAPETSTQKKTVKYQGKPVDASWNPKTDRLMYKGQDITQEAEHYEEPKTPLFSPLQSGSGYENYNRRTGGTEPLLGPDGKQLPLPDTSDARNRANAMQRVQPLIDTIKELSPVINQKPGIAAVFAGGWRQVLSKANEDDDVAEYASVVNAFTPLLARAEGHTGVLTEADFEHAMAILPTPRDSASLAQRKLARLQKILAGASGGKVPMPEGADTPKGKFTIELEK